MPTTAKESANLTKYNNGGSGDNVIANGQIKAVEKVWIDNYTLTGDMTSTNATIGIGKFPNDATITDITISVETSISQSSGNLSVGFSTDADAAAFGTLMGAGIITHAETLTSLRLPMQSAIDGVVDYDANFLGTHAGVNWVIAGTQNTIALKLNNWTMTTGTVKTIVRYTS